MFGISLEILKYREQTELPIILYKIINRLANNKIDFNIQLSKNQREFLADLKRKINSGKNPDLSMYDLNINISLLKYFIENVPRGSLLNENNKSFHDTLIIFIKSICGTMDNYLSLYPKDCRDLIIKIYNSFNSDTINISNFISTHNNKIFAIPNKLKELKYFDHTIKKRNILSLDGGGTRSIFTLKMLSYICTNMFGNSDDDGTKKFVKCFDLIGGTSAGSIIAIGLCSGYSINKLRTLFYTLSKDVFNDTWIGFPYKLYTYYKNNDYYSHAILLSFLENIFGNKKMFELSIGDELPKVFATTTNATTTVYDLNLFRSYDNISSKYEGTSDIRIVDTVRGSTAAPTFFGPYIDQYGNKYIDGGLCANNPTEVAIFEAYNLFPGDNINVILSLGTGKLKSVKSSSGIYELSQDILNMVTNAEITHTEILEWIKDYAPTINYCRFSPPDLGSVKLDTANTTILENGEILTERYIKSLQDQIDKLKNNL